MAELHLQPLFVEQFAADPFALDERASVVLDFVERRERTLRQFERIVKRSLWRAFGLRSALGRRLRHGRRRIGALAAACRQRKRAKPCGVAQWLAGDSS